MHAIIRQGNGKYYLSAVYGHYQDFKAKGYFKRFIQDYHKPYWIVWDAEKQRLIRWNHMELDRKYIIPQILIIDANRENWNMDEHGIGCVNFLSKELLESFLDSDEQPEDILDKCREIDEAFVYKEIQEVKTNDDIENLMWATGDFHDAYIIEEKLQADGTLYLRFGGIWGCELDVWFWGELEFDTSDRDSKYYDPNWMAATVILQDGFVYLVDCEDMTVGKIEKGYCYFKARHMKYRIIPN